MLPAFLHQDHSWTAYQKKKKRKKITKSVRPVAKIAEVTLQETLKWFRSQEAVSCRTSADLRVPAHPQDSPSRTAAQPGFRTLSRDLSLKAHALIRSKRKTGTILTSGKPPPFFPCTLLFCCLQVKSKFLYMGMCFNLCIWTSRCIDFKWKIYNKKYIYKTRNTLPILHNYFCSCF